MMNQKGAEMGLYYLIEIGESFDRDKIMKVKQTLEMAFAIGHKDIVFDLSQCEHINASAMGLIATAYKRCLSMQGRTILLHPTEAVKKLVIATGLDSLIEIYPSRKALELAYNSYLFPALISDREMV